MKFRLPRSLAIFTLGLLPLAELHAEVPETVHYQGRVTVAGEAFNGTGQFKFAVVDGGTENVSTATATANVNDGFVTSLTLVDGGNGYTTVPNVTLSGGSGTGATATATLLNGKVAGFNITANGSGYGSEAPTVVIAAPPPASIQTLWSNDGTSNAGSAPTAAVSLPVSGGVFSVILGDASLPGMTALPAATFASSPVRLRVWFDGGNGFELLTPDQPITSTPYAMRAASVAEGAIGAAQIDPGIALWSSISGKVSIQENVGIGTTSPQATLHVAEGTSGTGLILPGLRVLQNNESPNVIGGFSGNSVTGGVLGATISGGGRELYSQTNRVTDDYGTVGGGRNNQAGDGAGSTSDRSFSTVSGGVNNLASGSSSTVGGGSSNTASGWGATVPGGRDNTAAGDSSFAAGRRAKANHFGTFVWGGNNQFSDFASTGANQFLIRSIVGIGTTSPEATLHVAEGTSGTGIILPGLRVLQHSESPNVIGGFSGNSVAEGSLGVRGATISGGGYALGESTNRVAGNYGTIGGGAKNRAGSWNLNFATVSGGMNNFASHGHSTVGGGQSNTASASYSTVGGGQSNTASGSNSTVGGGAWNTASGSNSTVGGGAGNTAAGQYSFAAGRRAKANQNGTFVWADSTDANFSSTAANQFRVRANGGAEFQTGTQGMTVFSNATTSSGAAVQAESTNSDGIAMVGRNESTDATLVLNNRGTGPIIKAFNVGAVRMQLNNNGNLTIGGTLTQGSDERLKQDVEKLGGVLGDVLSLQPASYRMKDRGDQSGRLYGFIAQEVREVFPAVVSEDAESGLLSLSYSDFSVLAIQAIKEQQEIIQAQADRIGALEKAASRSEQLEARLVALEKQTANEPVASR